MAVPTIHVGCKGFGFSRLKALIACEGLEPVACVDIDVEGARRNIESLDSPIDQRLSERVYTTITEARERHHADACLIFASTPVHAGLVVESLGLGMHTLCVKPIAVDQAEFRTVMKARNARPALVLVQGQNKRWNRCLHGPAGWCFPCRRLMWPVSGSCSTASRFRRRRSRIPARVVPDASFNLGRSRVRESRSLGSVGAKAEWLSYPTNPRITAATGSRRGFPGGSSGPKSPAVRDDDMLPRLWPRKSRHHVAPALRARADHVAFLIRPPSSPGPLW